MRSLTFGILAGAGMALVSLPALAQSTTRIETRPFYGATVTVDGIPVERNAKEANYRTMEFRIQLQCKLNRALVVEPDSVLHKEIRDNRKQ